jgi:hypothetical protein
VVRSSVALHEAPGAAAVALRAGAIKPLGAPGHTVPASPLTHPGVAFQTP